MMYLDDDNRDDLGGDDDGDDGFVPATNPTKEDYDAVVKQNRRLYARAKKAKRGTKTDETATVETKKEPAQNVADDAAWKERIELKTEGYSDEEVEFIQKNGGKAAKENPFVKTAIETIRAQKKSEAAQVTDTAGKSEIEKQYTPEQLKAMPLAELEKILPKAQQ